MATSGSHHVVFDATCQADAYKLFELTPELEAALTSGQSVCFKGAPDEDVVLCTDAKTFSVRRVESSNTTLVAPVAAAGGENTPQNGTLSVVSSFGSTYELVEVAPRLEAARQMLLERPYAGASHEASGTAGLHGWDELRERSQASDAELRGFLRELDACEIGGFWRVLAPGLVTVVMDTILDGVDEHGWGIDSIPAEEGAAYVRTATDEDERTGGAVDAFVVAHCAAIYGPAPAAAASQPSTLALRSAGRAVRGQHPSPHTRAPLASPREERA